MCGKMKQQVAKDRIFKRTACTELGLSRIWGRNLCAKEVERENERGERREDAGGAWLGRASGRKQTLAALRVAPRATSPTPLTLDLL